jgi:hypothetical protein
MIKLITTKSLMNGDRKMLRKEMCKNHKYQAFNGICRECMPKEIRIKCLRIAIKEGEEKLEKKRLEENK